MWKLEKINNTKWSEYWAKIKGANLLQSIQYGDAKQGKFLHNYNYLIIDENKNPQGLVQILAREIMFFGGVARINRGPLFFNKNKDDLDTASFEKALLAIKFQASSNRWWYIRFAPELKLDQAWNDILIKNEMIKINNVSEYGSLLLSLNQSEEDLFTGLKGKWRNLLRKSMSFDIKVSCMNNVDDIEYLITRYNKYQEMKGFIGIPETLLRSLAKKKGDNWAFSILGAYSNDNSNEPVAMLVSIRHGDTSTYLIGMSDSDGRHLNANYLLLWHAILDAKKSGCRYFDLGGLNEDTTKGVAHFKIGTGGSDYQLIGEWHWFIGLGELFKKIFVKKNIC